MQKNFCALFLYLPIFLCIFFFSYELCFGIGKDSVVKERRRISNDLTKENLSNLVKAQLEFTSLRHKIISENIANLNTPGYRALDVKEPVTYRDLSDRNNTFILKVTHPKHIKNNKNSQKNFKIYKIQNAQEEKKNKNNVSLNQQLSALSQNQQEYNSALKINAIINSLLSTILTKSGS